MMSPSLTSKRSLPLSPRHSPKAQDSHTHDATTRPESASSSQSNSTIQAPTASTSQLSPRKSESQLQNKPRVRRRLSEAGDSARSPTDDAGSDSLSVSSSTSSLSTSATALTSPASPAWYMKHDTLDRASESSHDGSIAPPAVQLDSSQSQLSVSPPLMAQDLSSNSHPPSSPSTSLHVLKSVEEDSQKPKRALNRKKLSLVVPQNPLASTGSKSCPPSPLDSRAQPTEGGLDTGVTGWKVTPSAETGMTISAALKGGMSMRRRTSLPKLKLGAAAFDSGAKGNRPLVTSTAAEFGSDATRIQDSSDSVRMMSRKELDPTDLGSDIFPYQSGPVEILPGLYLGSEQNAKNPQILSSLGITAVLNVAKEVLCPWTAEEVIVEEDEEKEEEAKASTSYLSPNNLPFSPRPAPDPSAPVESASSSYHHLFIRPATSTPNLQAAFARIPSPSNSPPRKSRSPQPSQRSTPPRSISSSSSIALGTSDTIHRRFPANSRTGSPPLEYIKLPWNHDQADLCQQFIGIFAFLDRIRSQGGSALVHCQCGVSRSASAVIGYVMAEATNQMGMHDAYNFVKDKSEWISPYIGLVYQLVEWEKKLKGGNAAKRFAGEMEVDEGMSDPSSSPTNSSSSFESRLATPATQQEALQPVLAASPCLDGNLLSPSLAETLVISPQLGQPHNRSHKLGEQLLPSLQQRTTSCPFSLNR